MFEESKKFYPSKRYLILTYGCQMNERDSEVIEGYLDNLGYCPAENERDADLILLNTCCVREKAELKVFGKLGQLKKLKEINPDLIIGICGCMTQQEEVFHKIKTNAPYVDLIFGTHNVHQLPRLISQVEEGNDPVYEIWETEGEIVEGLATKRKDKVKAYVNISYGCNNYCTYCIVPYVRGRERSRRPEKIIEEINSLAEEGYKEVMLLGQNVNSYGKDLSIGVDFADLLIEVDKIKKIDRVRYMTSHPKDFSEKLVKTIPKCQKVCEHYHLPIQAGSNYILRKMNRGYTREQYIELIERIRDSSHNCAVTSDIIVGFPGETEDDFKKTLDIITMVRFDVVYSFAYSSRRGTLAEKMKDQIPLDEKKQRLQKLMDVQNEISLDINNKLVGKTVEVLVEGKSKFNCSKMTGRTRTNKIVNFEGDETLIGQLINVKLIQAQTWNLTGELL
ncbi:MAG: tRNA (N6-isopentenyl adenosine(37)-C2)-methylthiotransferase MiaB [Bacillota bacterium]